VDQVRLESQRPAEEYKLQDQAAQQLPEEQTRTFAPEPPAVMVPPQAAPAPAPASPPPALAKAEAERSNIVTPPEEVRVDAKALREQSAATLPVTVEQVVATSPAPPLEAEQPTPSLAGSAADVPARKEVERAAAEADSSDHDLSSVSIAGTRARRPAGRTAGPRGTISGSLSSGEARPAADEDPERSDPQKWLEEIRELRRAGKVAEADRAWQQFREAFPKFPVANEDIARKK
jgi:hypothetical protein